jgi:two-component system CheB/CheR fusion protein
MNRDDHDRERPAPEDDAEARSGAPAADEHDPDQHAPEQFDPNEGPVIVGIGASAGGLKALRAFFEHVPADSGLAYVVVVHLSPEHESHLADLLQPHVNMAVQQVQGEVPLKPDTVYVIPPGANLNTIDTHLRLSDLEERRRERAPIDHFFRTLARTHDGHSIGVVLTGTGSDGTLGLKEIKERAGLTIVQDPAEAEYDGMPQSAIATGLVDLVLPLAEIPAAIQRYAGTRPRLPIPIEETDVGGEERQILHKVFAQIRARTGHDFSRYKRSTILRRIRRRMQLRFVEEFPAYLALLREQPDEVHALAEDLLITVTSFFRDPEVFEVLETEIVPQLFEGKDADDHVRLWSVGCATGEEAYSLAILLLEEAARRGAGHEAVPTLQIFASDLHEHSLAKAREGFYPGDIAADVSAERLSRFFHQEDGGYRIQREVRELVVFAPHNLLGDPPFSRLDFITCRNVMIYLQRDVQRDVVELFHYALNPGGILALGTSETIDGSDFFQSVDKRACVWRKRNVPAPEPRLPVFPLTRPRYPDDPAPPERGGQPIAYGVLHQRMVERYAPPSVLVSPDDKVVHFSEHAGRYLTHPGGEPTTSAFQLVREELRIELRALLHDARRRQQPVRSKPLAVRFDDRERPVVLHARPTPEPDQQGFVLVIFDEREPEAEGGAADPEADGAGPDAASRARLETERDDMETELGLSRQRLQGVIEEYDTTQEELKASNEELQSANEELRSTLEELETSKEELQSMNEELQTVNQENLHKVEELAQLSSDLQNLMAATKIATLFLDRELRILRFTPRIGELFSVRPADRGRPLADLTHRLGYDELHADAQRVLDQLVPVEREVEDDEGRWYLTRVLPYRSADDRIEGVVITFVDITTRRAATDALHRSEERYRLLVDSATEYAILMLDTDGRIVSWNPGAERIFGYNEDEILGEDVARLFTDEDLAAGALQREMGVAAETGHALNDRWHMRKDGSRFWANGVMEALHRPDGSLGGFAKVLRDNTDRKRTEDELRQSEEQLRELNETLEERVQERTAQVRTLASTLAVAEQDERRRIAQILHDDLQQLLFGIQLKMTFIRKGAEEADAPALAEHAAESEDFLDRAIQVSRQLTVDLSPPVLAGDGLSQTLEWLTTQMEVVHGLTVELRAEQPFVIPQEGMRVLLFQIIRELLFNVVKHAGTDRASVSIVEVDGGLRITVADGGDGFDPDALEPRPEGGFGLFSVRERLQLFGGRLEMHSSPGEGARMTAIIPDILAPPQER